MPSYIPFAILVGGRLSWGEIVIRPRTLVGGGVPQPEMVAFLDRQQRQTRITFQYLQRGGSILTMSLGFPLSAVQDEAGIKST